MRGYDAMVHQERNTMTRKHFVKLASAISEIPIKRDRIEFARVVGDMCSARNCNFDDSRWNEACRV